MAKKGAGSKTDTIVKLVLMFFISLLSFSVGTYVGKQVSESEYQALQYESNEYKSFRDVASADKAEETEEKSDAISEEEVSQLAEEFMAKEKKEHKAQQHPEPSKKNPKTQAKKTEDGYKNMKSGKAEKATPEQAASKTQNKTTPEAQRVAAGKAPSADPKKKRKPASVFPKVASDTVGRYTVQVASYSNKSEAETHASNLKSKGYDAFFLKAEVKGRTWFRVSMGLFANVKEAQAYKNKLKKDSVVSSAIVQRIVK